MIFLIMMIGCLIYFAVLVALAGISSPFAWFWPVMAVLFGLLYGFITLIKRGVIRLKLPLWLKAGFWTTTAIAGALVLLIEAMVLFGMFSQASPDDLDYLIVLGTYVDGDQPSESLAHRLDKAIEYMEMNEKVVAIVTGGKGTADQPSEAYVMANYLLDHGIKYDRIMLEEKATSTRENLIFSYELIGDKDATVGIVTNSFHVYRAMALADKLDFDGAVGIAAPSDKLLLPSYMAREFFVIIKEKIMGYI
ncbi:MAG: YdcF family protein [Lachnospiraceae bacterium]|nr:YdcF family protein [Lachnospiraceae bacterium]